MNYYTTIPGGQYSELLIISKTHGIHRAKFDTQDLHKLTQFKWYIFKVKNTYYTQATINKKRRTMHSFLFPELTHIDHIDHDGLNNQRSNLRQCTIQQNACNNLYYAGRPIQGYHWNSKRNKFIGAIVWNRKHKYLGSYDTPEEANAAYLRAKELRDIEIWANNPPLI